MGSTAAIRRRQVEAADGPEGLAFVRDWVQAKLRHQIETATGVILVFFQTNHDGTFCLSDAGPSTMAISISVKPCSR
jgi:hypothetical protein